jgi:hypothetical protein
MTEEQFEKVCECIVERCPYLFDDGRAKGPGRDWVIVKHRSEDGLLCFMEATRTVNLKDLLRLKIGCFEDGWFYSVFFSDKEKIGRNFLTLDEAISGLRSYLGDKEDYHLMQTRMWKSALRASRRY